MISAPSILFGTVVLSAVAVSAVQMRGSADGGNEYAVWFVDDNGDRCYYYKDTDRTGFDIANKPAQDYHDCDRMCMDFKGCVTWSWNNYNGGTCWLKSGLSGLAHKPGTTSLSCAVPTKEPNYSCKQHWDIDFVGNDIGNKPGRTSECCTICDRTPGCKAYSWAYENNVGTCYLKSGVGDAISKPGVVSGATMSNIGRVCPFEYDMDFVGGDIGNKPAKDPSVCCSICKGNPECKAYTWSNYNGGTCWMKNTRGNPTKTAGMVSAWLV
jgi:hypothetical protein